MRTITHTTTLRGAPEQVFALLSHVPNFVELCDRVEAIEPLGEDRYRWTVRAAGMRLHFEVEVCAAKPPERFAWRSIRGLKNHGSYHLQPAGPGHTRVDFELHYRLGNPLLEAAVRRAAGSLVEQVSGQMMERVQARLDAESGGRHTR